MTKVIKNDNLKYLHPAPPFVKASDLVKRMIASRKAVFSLSDLSKMIGKDRAYSKVFANRMTRGDLLNLERDKYVLRGTDPFVVASNVVFPSYISFISAYQYYGMTTRLPRAVFVVTLRQRKDLIYDDTLVHFVKLPMHRFFGTERETREGKYLFIATPEKAVVDSLYLPKYCRASETLFALRNASLDLGRLVTFAQRMGSVALLKRLGFLLEMSGASAPERWRSSSRDYVLLNPSLSRGGQKDERWRLIVNEALE